MLWCDIYMMKIIMFGNMECANTTYLCNLNDMI